MRRALSIVGLVFALLLDSGCAENKTSSANRELEVIPASHRALEWQNRFDRWVTSHQSEVRDLQRELAEIHSDDSAEGEQLSFSLSHFAYFTRVERGYAQPLLVRRKLNSALHEYETVTSPGFGSNGYPFLLQRFAICPTEERVALAGSVGPVNVLCVRNPTLSDITCVPSEEVSALAWHPNCQTLFFAEYHNGRSDQLYSADSAALDHSFKLLEEPDPAYSISLKTSEDGNALLVSSASELSSELSIVEFDSPAAKLHKVWSRSEQRQASLHRAGNSWWLLERSAAHPGLFAVKSLDPLAVSEPPVKISPLETIAHAVGFAGALLLEGRREGAQRLALLPVTPPSPPSRVLRPIGELLSRPLPPGLGHFTLAPVQNYGGELGRLLASGPEVPTCELRANLRDLALDDSSCKIPALPQIEIHERMAISRDGTKVPYTLMVPPGPTKRVVLETYGAYAESLDPRYSPTRHLLLKHQTAIALAHPRGGGERGEAWHSAASASRRSVASDDLEAVAETLRAELRLPIVLSARSAGGVTAFHTFQAHPELFSALVLDSPLLDVISVISDPARPSSKREYAEWGEPSDLLLIKFWEEFAAPSARDVLASSAPILITMAENDSAVPPLDTIRFLEQPPAKVNDSQLYVQWIPQGTHDGASYLSDEQKYQAERLAFALSR